MNFVQAGCAQLSKAIITLREKAVKKDSRVGSESGGDCHVR